MVLPGLHEQASSIGISFSGFHSCLLYLDACHEHAVDIFHTDTLTRRMATVNLMHMCAKG